MIHYTELTVREALRRRAFRIGAWAADKASDAATWAADRAGEAALWCWERDGSTSTPGPGFDRWAEEFMRTSAGWPGGPMPDTLRVALVNGAAPAGPVRLLPGADLSDWQAPPPPLFDQDRTG